MEGEEVEVVQIVDLTTIKSKNVFIRSSSSLFPQQLRRKPAPGNQPTSFFLWTITFIVLLLVVVEFPPGCLTSYASDRHAKSKDPAPFQCEPDIKNCIEPVTSKLCSGKGACVCGQCACFNTEFEKYFGRFCEHCESCSLNLCGLLQPCVECRVHETGPFSTHQDCVANCSRFPEIQIAEVTSSDEKVDHYFCAFKDVEDCEFYFVYGYDAEGHLVIIAQREKECPARLATSSSSKSSSTSTTSQQQSSQRLEQERGFGGRNYKNGRKFSTATPPPPVLTDLPNNNQLEIINDFIDSPASEVEHHDHHQSGLSAPSYNNNNDPEDDDLIGRKKNKNNNNNHRVKTRKKLNTDAFDLMIVCGLSMTRSSSETSQQPQYFQRNGIHFDVKNCQFIPNSEQFVFTSDGHDLKMMNDDGERRNSAANSLTKNNIFTIFFLSNPPHQPALMSSLTVSVLFSLFYYYYYNNIQIP